MKRLEETQKIYNLVLNTVSHELKTPVTVIKGALAILKTDEWKDVAGYRIEGIISAFIHRMSGSYDSVVGIPVYDVVHILRGILG